MPPEDFPAPIHSDRESFSDLQRELDRLTAHQEMVRSKAMYGGMMPDEAKEYDIRRMKISQLAERLLQERATDDSAG